MKAFAAVKPTALEKHLFRCKSSSGSAVYKVSWTTGYVTGNTFFAESGDPLGENWHDDVDQQRTEFDERTLAECRKLL
jgi:hypothetical protein